MKYEVYNNTKLKMSSFSETQHALCMLTRTFEKYKQESFLNLKHYSDGLPFASMLSSIEYFRATINDLDQNPEKWTQKLANLKKLITRMQSYVDSQSDKALMVNDIELVQIAKNASQEQILKFFQVVIAVLMQTPQKQDYIQRIMDLDQKSQQALVIVVQNAMQYRISQKQENSQMKNIQSLEQMTKIHNQNQVLTLQINELCQQNLSLQKHNKQLKDRIHECEEQIQKARNLNIQMYMNNSSTATQSQRQNSLIETLKKKMIQMSRQHELQLTKDNQQIYHLKSRLTHSKEIEEELLQSKRLLDHKIKKLTSHLQAESKGIQKVVAEKDGRIKKVQYELQIAKNKIRQLSEDIQVNDLNLRMELQKKEVRFKQLQKQVKQRLIQPPVSTGLMKTYPQQPQNQDKEEQIQYLKAQVCKLRNLNGELERQCLKTKKRSQKVQGLQSQKKKLQKIILDVSKCRDSQIQMLVVSLYDLRNENVKMHQIIAKLNQRQSVI